jgi:non-ribosomal peptide synthetase component F
LREVQKTAVEAYKHEDYPFDRLVNELNLPKDTSRSPLFNINVALQNSFTKGEQSLELDDVSIEPVFSRHISSKWDLAFDFIEDKNGLTASIEYYSDLYSKEMIADMASNFKVLLQSVLENPQCSIKEQNCLTEAFLNKILTIPEKVEVNGDNNLVSWFERVAKEYSNRPAVQDFISSLTFGELDKKSGQVAEFLKDHGSGKGKYVAIYMENSVETVIALWGILKSGAAYIPIDTSYPYNRIQSIIDNAGVEQIISKKQYICSLNRLLWECQSMKSFLCLDSEDIISENRLKKMSS